mgnify:CR=1 FL=1
MRSLSATLLAAQEAVSGTPYIRLVFSKGATTYDYTSRLKSLVHYESPYYGEARIWLDNADLAVVDLAGYYVDIGYGYTTGAGNEYSSAPRLWVIQQSNESEEGRLETVLYLEDIWRILREIQNVGALGATAPFFDVNYDGTVDTVYAILEDVLETCADVDLDALAVDDGIIGTLKPKFSINGPGGFEDIATMVYRLMNMTLCFLRPSGNYVGTKLSGFKLVYPQAADVIDYEYYSDQAHFFYQCFWKENVVAPNHIYVIANQAADGTWPSPITGAYQDTTSPSYYDDNGARVDIPEYHFAGDLANQTDADNRATAIYWKNWYELEWGVVVVPHNCGQELFDKVKVYDSRGL